MSNILVIEPGSTPRRLIDYVLTRAGFAVTSVTDSAHARIALESSTPTLAFCEMDLPDGSGLDLVAELRAAGTDYVVMLSTRTRPQDREQALAAGADDLIGKPLSPARLRTLADAHASAASVASATVAT
jgi:DNA-binding response OmpR family regulator